MRQTDGAFRFVKLATLSVVGYFEKVSLSTR